MNIFKNRRKLPDGWEDLGIARKWTSIGAEGKTITNTLICHRCKSELRIARNDNTVFRYCPLCLTRAN